MVNPATASPFSAAFFVGLPSQSLLDRLSPEHAASVSRWVDDLRGILQRLIRTGSAEEFNREVSQTGSQFVQVYLAVAHAFMAELGPEGVEVALGGLDNLEERLHADGDLPPGLLAEHLLFGFATFRRTARLGIDTLSIPPRTPEEAALLTRGLMLMVPSLLHLLCLLEIGRARVTPPDDVVEAIVQGGRRILSAYSCFRTLQRLQRGAEEETPLEVGDEDDEYRELTLASHEERESTLSGY